jgi:3-oxoacyl-(acyl-carrier-protein) synthase
MEEAHRHMRAVITGTGAVAPRGPSQLEPLQLADGSEAPVTGFPVEGFNLKDHIPTVTSYVDRCSALGLAASKLALEAAGALERDSRSGDWGLAFATAWGCLDSMELFFAKVAEKPKFAPPLVFSHCYANSPTSMICIEFGLPGTGATFSEGATGAITALGWARDRLLRTGGSELEGVLVTASDSLSAALRRHFAASGRLAGEAGAAVTLEPEESARKRGAAPLAAVLGWGSAFGGGALERATDAAITEAGLSPADLNGCHGPAAEVLADVPRTDLAERCGQCGPAAALLAAAEVCAAPAGNYLITARDPAGNAAALILERIA